jgi:hypothetical protein
MSAYRRTYETTSMKASSLNQSQKVKPFCKVCYDTGKTVEMYSSHFVRENRDPNSRILCPTLLALECRYCFIRGHTVSKCPKLEQTKSGNGANVCDAPKKKAPASRNNNDDRSTCSNGFSMLYSSDDEVDDDAVTESVTELSSVFPGLNSHLNTVNEVSNRTYAAALMAVLKQKKVNVVSDDDSCVSSVSGCSIDLRKIFVNNRKYSAPGSWAQDSDSDDD